MDIWSFICRKKVINRLRVALNCLDIRIDLPFVVVNSYMSRERVDL